MATQVESADLLAALGAILIALSTSMLFFPALRLPSRSRALALVCVLALLALIPWAIPSEARILRLLVTIYAGVLALKVWDLHVGASRSVRPGWRDFAGFMANPLCIVHRRTGFERPPPPRRDAARLLESLTVASLGFAVLWMLLRLPWHAAPFLVEHVLKATSFFVGVTALSSAAAAACRLLGLYAPEPMARPLAAPSPAEFWRRYNRWIGEGLREDLFRLVGGRRHPVRATLTVFLVSAVLHEYVFTVALRSVQGYQLAFFSLQGMLVVLTMRWKPHPVVGAVTTFTLNAVTSILFFASFQGLVPLYDGGLPSWLWGV